MTFTINGSSVSFDIVHLPFNVDDAIVDFIPSDTLKLTYQGDIYEITSAEKISYGKQKALPQTTHFNDLKNSLTNFFGQGGFVTIPNTYDIPDGLASISFSNIFLVNPLVFMIPNQDGSDAAYIRYKNITTSGFDAVIVEPSNYDGSHIGQTVGYYAFLPGKYNIGSITIEVGYVETTKCQGDYAPVGSDIGWERVTLTQNYPNLAVITSLQTMNNEQNAVPTTISSPWMTPTVKIVDDRSFDLTLDRSDTSTDIISVPERVAYIAFSSNQQSTFTTSNNVTVKVETIKGAATGWDDGGSDVYFNNTYSTTPIILSSINSRKDSQGGWIRFDNTLTDATKVNLKIDHDTTQQAAKNHTAEDAAVLVFEKAFTLTKV